MLPSVPCDVADSKCLFVECYRFHCMIRSAEPNQIIYASKPARSKARSIFASILIIINSFIFIFAYYDTLQAMDPESYTEHSSNTVQLFNLTASYISGQCLYYNDSDIPPMRDEIWVMYNLLNDKDKKVYNLFLNLVEHRNEDDYTNGIIIDKQTLEEIGSDHFWKIYDAMLYDHPEFFFLISNSDMISCQSITTANYKTFIYAMNPETEKESQQIKAFDAATEEFLSDIDLNLPKEEIELAIHDKLISLVSYDYDLLEETKLDNTIRDLGQSAYGALVCDSYGRPNSAVCMGYSFAFEYLCQLAGIPCCTITGNVSNITDDPSEHIENGHTWNGVKIDNRWYEVDVTWDDYEYKEPMELSFFEALQSDSEKFYNLLHHFYNKTTAEMEYLYAEEDTIFEIEGYLPFNIREDSSHIRYTAIKGDPGDSDAFRNRLIPLAY